MRDAAKNRTGCSGSPIQHAMCINSQEPFPGGRAAAQLTKQPCRSSTAWQGGHRQPQPCCTEAWAAAPHGIPSPQQGRRAAMPVANLLCPQAALSGWAAGHGSGQLLLTLLTSSPVYEAPALGSASLIGPSRRLRTAAPTSHPSLHMLLTEAHWSSEPVPWRLWQKQRRKYPPLPLRFTTALPCASSPVMGNACFLTSSALFAVGSSCGNTRFNANTIADHTPKKKRNCG